MYVNCKYLYKQLPDDMKINKNSITHYKSLCKTMCMLSSKRLFMTSNDDIIIGLTDFYLDA